MENQFYEWCSRHRWLLIFGLLTYLCTAWFNIGIIASDDYEFGIARIVPAQNWTALSIIHASGIRSPIPNLVLFAFTKTAFFLGFKDPVTQLRFALLFVGLFSYLVYSTFSFAYFREDENKSSVALFLLSFYFLAPMIFTRPLIENLSAPFLFISCWAACEYFKKPQLKHLFISVATLTLACTFRFQAISCATALVLVVVIKRSWRDILPLILAGLLGLFLSGTLDWIYKGGFHASFLAYSRYQAENIHRFGAQPAYVFVALFLGLSMPPLLFQRYHNFSWRTHYSNLVPALLFWFIFTLAHSVVVHKEERFMVPMLPIFFILLTPLATYTWKHSKRRTTIFYALNFSLLPLASLNASQTNLINAARFVAHHPEFKSVVGVDGTLFNFPNAFIPRPLTIKDISSADLTKGTAFQCGEILLIRKDIRESIAKLEYMQFLGSSEPGFLEWVVIKLNPSKNKRRGPIEFYAHNNCPH